MSDSAVNNKEIPFGTIIDSRYLIQKVLGQGGLGRTYLALDTHRFNEPCVLKEFAPLGSGQYDLEKSRSLFKREAKILHQVTHPQIPKFLACFEGKKRLFLVQEYVKGKTYSQLLQERQQQGRVFSEKEVSRWLLNMLPILSYIHQRGIIHRDISPDNIMQPQTNELPVLIDFGVGKLTNLGYGTTEHNSSSQSQSFVGRMSFVGKVGYAPREQISMGRCSPSSDLYALGVTAIVLLTGKMPTLLLDQYTLEWQWRRYAQTSREFTQILDKMIEDIPMQRYQSAEDVIVNLQEIQELQEDTLTPELTTITDSHFYQKISLFTQKQNLKNNKKANLSVKNKKRENTIIHPAFSTKNSHSKIKQDRSFDNRFTPKQKKPKTDRLSQTSSASSMEETVALSSSLDHEDRENTTLKTNSTHPHVNHLPKQSPRLNRPSAKSKNPALEERDFLRVGVNSDASDRSSGYQIITERFIGKCQKELAYIIGPMASLIVEETLLQNQSLHREKLVEILAEHIPNKKQAIVFKQKLLF